MLEQTDTRTISVDQPVEDVLLKIQEGAAAVRRPSDIYEDEPSSSVPVSHTVATRVPTASLPHVDSDWDYIEKTRAPFFKWLSLCATRLSRGLVTSLAATQISLARMNSEELGTIALDVGAIVQASEQDHWVKVTVSPELIKTRPEVFASSLFAPSGAELTWLALEEVEDHGKD